MNIEITGQGCQLYPHKSYHTGVTIHTKQEFVEYAVTQQRFDQAITEIFGRIENIDVTKMGDFLRWIIKDIMSEEMDTMTENDLEPKDVNKYISHKAKEMFFAEYNAVS